MREFRSRAGLTQAQLGALVKLTSRQIRNAESGRVVGTAALRRIADAMRVAGSGDLARQVQNSTYISIGDEQILERRLEGVERRIESAERRLSSLEQSIRSGAA